MPMTVSKIEQLIKTAMPDAKVVIEPLADDDDHYRARIVSGAFAGQTRLQQHRMVYQALAGHMGSALHALQLTTSATE